MKTRILLIEWDRDLLERMRLGLISQLRDVEVIAHRTFDLLGANDTGFAVAVLGASTDDGSPSGARVIGRTLDKFLPLIGTAKVVLFTNNRLPREGLRINDLVLKPSTDELAKAVGRQIAPAAAGAGQAAHR